MFWVLLSKNRLLKLISPIFIMFLLRLLKNFNYTHVAHIIFLLDRAEINGFPII